jgi:hypothetical protein
MDIFSDLILLGVLGAAVLGALAYVRRSNQPRLKANGLSSSRQQAMTTAQGVAMTQAVAGRSEAQPQRRQQVSVAAPNQRAGAVKRR